MWRTPRLTFGIVAELNLFQAWSTIVHLRLNWSTWENQHAAQWIINNLQCTTLELWCYALRKVTEHIEEEIFLSLKIKSACRERDKIKVVVAKEKLTRVEFKFNKAIISIVAREIKNSSFLDS